MADTPSSYHPSCKGWARWREPGKGKQDDLLWLKMQTYFMMGQARKNGMYEYNKHS